MSTLQACEHALGHNLGLTAGEPVRERVNRVCDRLDRTARVQVTGPSGITLEDEKVLGTCHLALGRNDLFGGTVRASVHVDGVLTRPRVLLDGEELSLDGREPE